MSERGPLNLHVVNHRGSKSFVELLKNNKQQLLYKEALPGRQVPDGAFMLAFQIALGLAHKNPDIQYQYTQYDHEDVVPENENNRPFRDGALCKTIYLFGYWFETHL